MSNLFSAIADTANARPADVAFECPDSSSATGPAGSPEHQSSGRTSFSFKEMLDESARLAGALKALGAAPGDRVLVQLEKSLPGVWLYLAVLRIGAVYLPLNAGYTEHELDYFVGDAEPSVVVTEASRLDATRKLLAGRATPTTLDALIALGRDTPPVSGVESRAPSDLAAILYTSGTTGRSKGAMLTHDNLESNARTLVQAWGFSRTDVLLHTLPIFHVHGLFVALHCALLSGAKTLFYPRFEAAAAKHALRQATVFMGVPTYYTRLLAEPDFPLPTTKLRLYVSGSAPLRPETFVEFERRTGSRILERYGMTEAGMITSNPLDGDRIAGVVGPPLPGVEVRVRTTTGTLAATNQPGVLEIKGRNVFSGYWRNAGKTRESFTRDGWFVTGDVATIDDAGRVALVGRDKDLIISGGLNVYPKEVEDELDGFPGVREAAVVGVPHPDFGEAVVAVVDAAGHILDEAAIITSIRQRLAGFKVPKRVVFRAELPRNAMGKVQKNVLREQLKNLFNS